MTTVRGHNQLFIMKNLISLTVFACLLVLTSCTKEDFPLPTPEHNSSIADEGAPVALATSLAQVQTNEENQLASDIPTMTVRVSRVTATQVGGEYIVDFAGDFDFTSAQLKNSQTLRFLDSNGVATSLSFATNSFVGSDGALQVTLAISSNDLTGLSLVTAQDIIIVDEILG